MCIFVPSLRWDDDRMEFEFDGFYVCLLSYEAYVGEWKLREYYILTRS